MSSATSEQIAAWVGALGDYVPPSFVEGIARAEHGKTSAVNIPAGDSTAEPNSTTSIGLCQINASEAQSVGYSASDLTDPQSNAEMFYKLCAQRGPNLENIGIARGTRDFFKYLAFYHNAGGGPALAFAQGNTWKGTTESSFNSGKTLSYADYAADFAINNSSGPTGGSGDDSSSDSSSTDTSSGDSGATFGDTGSIGPGLAAVAIVGALVASGVVK